MADKERLTSETCRLRAQHCRDMARDATDPATRKGLEDLAVQWDHLCEEISKMADRT